jgi:hypothetical protein
MPVSICRFSPWKMTIDSRIQQSKNMKIVSSIIDHYWAASLNGQQATLNLEF